MRRKLIAALVVLVALLCFSAAAFIFLWQGRLPIPATGPVPDVAESPMPDTVPPSAAELASPAPANEASGALNSPDMLAREPSFDVVHIEPTGEAVIAGRAEPGWKVSVEADDAEVAEVVADEQGEWAVVVDKPLPGGDHVLSLRATSPDGARALPSVQTVATEVPVGSTQNAAIVKPSSTGPTSPESSAPALKPRGASPEILSERASAPQTAGAETAADRRQVQPRDAPPNAAATLPQTAAVDETDPVPPRTLAEQDKPGEYTILPGDTLWDIAERYLGGGWRYPSIHRNNRDIIRNPHLIHPDQRVKVPEEP